MTISPLPYDTFLYTKADRLHGFAVLATEIPFKGCLTVYPGVYPIPAKSRSFYQQYAKQITREIMRHGISKAVLHHHELHMIQDPIVYDGPPYMVRIQWRCLGTGIVTSKERVCTEYRGKLRVIRQDGYSWCPINVYRIGRLVPNMTLEKLKTLPQRDTVAVATLWIRWQSHIAEYPYIHPDEGLILYDSDITFEICSDPPEALVQKYTPGVSPTDWISFMKDED